MSTPKRSTAADPTPTAERTWKAVEARADADEMDRILAMSPAEIDAELAAGGHDPARLRADGAALGRRLVERRAREALAEAEIARLEERLARRAAERGKLPRNVLLERIQAACADPRLPERAAVLFRGRKTEEASNEELEALLDELEQLADEHDEHDEEP